jgi:hypothetical protein
MMTPSRGDRALNARVRGLAHACGAPVSVAGPGRGRDGPSSETRPARGGVIPRAGRDHSREELLLERGGARPRGSAPSSEAEPARGGFQGGRLGGPSESRGVGRVLHG